MSKIFAERYHDISCGHRVHGHENKCRHLHGHNYRVHFQVSADNLDEVGRVLDFGVIKSKLCIWLEENWDHKFLIWIHDPIAEHLEDLDPTGVLGVPFNPTAENMAEYLLTVIGPKQLEGTGTTLHSVRIEETMKCSVSCKID